MKDVMSTISMWILKSCSSIISELKQATFLTTRTAWVTLKDWVKNVDWLITSNLLPGDVRVVKNVAANVREQLQIWFVSKIFIIHTEGTNWGKPGVFGIRPVHKLKHKMNPAWNEAQTEHFTHRGQILKMTTFKTSIYLFKIEYYIKFTNLTIHNINVNNNKYNQYHQSRTINDHKRKATRINSPTDWYYSKCC